MGWRREHEQKVKKTKNKTYSRNKMYKMYDRWGRCRPPSCQTQSQGKETCRGRHWLLHISRILYYTKLPIKDLCWHTGGLGHRPRLLMMDEGSLITEIRRRGVNSIQGWDLGWINKKQDKVPRARGQSWEETQLFGKMGRGTDRYRGRNTLPQAQLTELSIVTVGRNAVCS